MLGASAASSATEGYLEQLVHLVDAGKLEAGL
jgi:hypothetical protein